MRVLNDYRCNQCGYTVEKLVENDIMTIDCQDCQGVATKVRAVPHFSLDPFSGDFPGAYQKWDRDRQRKAAKETED